MSTEYGLHIPDALERRILRCPAPVRDAIRQRLRQIAIAAGKARPPIAALAPEEPPLRFYVYEGHRIAYQLEAHRRRVVVLDLKRLSVD